MCVWDFFKRVGNRIGRIVHTVIRFLSNIAVVNRFLELVRRGRRRLQRRPSRVRHESGSSILGSSGGDKTPDPNETIAEGRPEPHYQVTEAEVHQVPVTPEGITPSVKDGETPDRSSAPTNAELETGPSSATDGRTLDEIRSDEFNGSGQRTSSTSEQIALRSSSQQPSSRNEKTLDDVRSDRLDQPTSSETEPTVASSSSKETSTKGSKTLDDVSSFSPDEQAIISSSPKQTSNKEEKTLDDAPSPELDPTPCLTPQQTSDSSTSYLDIEARSNGETSAEVKSEAKAVSLSSKPTSVKDGKPRDDDSADVGTSPSFIQSLPTSWRDGQKSDGLPISQPKEEILTSVQTTGISSTTTKSDRTLDDVRSSELDKSSFPTPQEQSVVSSSPELFSGECEILSEDISLTHQYVNVPAPGATDFSFSKADIASEDSSSTHHYVNYPPPAITTDFSLTSTSRAGRTLDDFSSAELDRPPLSAIEAATTGSTSPETAPSTSLPPDAPTDDDQDTDTPVAEPSTSSSLEVFQSPETTSGISIPISSIKDYAEQPSTETGSSYRGTASPSDEKTSLTYIKTYSAPPTQMAKIVPDEQFTFASDVVPPKRKQEVSTSTEIEISPPQRPSEVSAYDASGSSRHDSPIDLTRIKRQHLISQKVPQGLQSSSKSDRASKEDPSKQKRSRQRASNTTQLAALRLQLRQLDQASQESDSAETSETPEPRSLSPDVARPPVEDPDDVLRSVRLLFRHVDSEEEAFFSALSCIRYLWLEYYP